MKSTVTFNLFKRTDFYSKRYAAFNKLLKLRRLYLILATFLILISCNKEKKSESIQTSKNENIDSVLQLEEVIDSVNYDSLFFHDRAKLEYIDSLIVKKSIDSLLEALKPSKKSVAFDSKMNFKYLFGNIHLEKNPFRLITKYSNIIGYYWTYVYDENDELLLSIKNHQNTYVNDTLIDINGDSFKDYVHYWYPMSGCCLADIQDVYLYNPENNSFSSNNFEFCNTYFYPSREIFSMSYGHPGETELSYLKWKGFNEIDTLEVLRKIKINSKYYYLKENCATKQVDTLESIPDYFLEGCKNYITWFGMETVDSETDDDSESPDVESMESKLEEIEGL